MTAAEDLHRRQEAEIAIGRLFDGRPYTRKGLFSRIERWQESLLRRLVNSGAVSVDVRGRGKPSLYQMRDSVMVQAMLDDEDALLQMVFPSYKPIPKLDETTPMLPGIEPEPEPETDDDDVTTETLKEALGSSDVMSTEILLKLLVGMIQLLNGHTEQLDKLDKKMTRLLKELTE